MKKKGFTPEQIITMLREAVKDQVNSPLPGPR